MTAQRRIDIAELHRLALTGMSAVGIASTLGFHAKNIRHAAARAGIAIQQHYEFGSTISEFWAANTERALRLRDEGLSATKIGAELGCTKNAVISLFNRRGLCRPRTEATGDSVFWLENDSLLTELHRHGWSNVRIARRIGRAQKSVQARLRRLRQRAIEQFMREFPVRLARVEFPPSGHCLFPTEHAPSDPEFTFCGARRQIGSSYCAVHHQIAWRPVERKQRAMAVE